MRVLIIIFLSYIFISCENKKNDYLSLANEAMSKREFTKALEYYKSCYKENKDSFAAFSCGEMYFDGLGVERDYKKAFNWFSKIETNSHAQSFLGLMYLRGLGCEKDEDKGIQILKEASSKGACLAQAVLGQYYFDRKEYKEAFECLSSAADRRCIKAFYPLALMYERGLGVDVDHDKSYKYFKLAALNNTNKSAYPIAAKKSLERKDYELALRFAKMSIDAGIDVEMARSIIKEVDNKLLHDASTSGGK